jgi:hypothetical protein
MIMDYNNTEEYNTIQTGNTVYISGIPGKNYFYCNNKYGWVKEILLTSTNRNLTYVAQVVLTPSGEEVFVNFDYIYRVKTLNKSDAHAIASIENPIEHYSHKKNFIDVHPFHDENGQLLSLCTNIFGRKYLLLCSGVN